MNDSEDDCTETWTWEELGPRILKAIESTALSGIPAGASTLAKEVQSRLWAQVKWRNASSKYRRSLLNSVRHTRVLGRDKAIELSQIYTDVLIYSNAEAFRRSEMLGDEFTSVSQHEDAFDKIPGIDAVRTGENLYILGRPGAGKTTFLKHIAMLACKSQILKTPVYIPLREHSISVGTRVEELIADEFHGCQFPDRLRFASALLASGKAILLLDGLDEVTEEGGIRSHLVAELARFARRYRDTQICLTCRIAATEFAFELFRYIEVADFNELQKEQFIDRWFAYDEKRRTRFIERWQKSELAGLRELARTPLLLTLICLSVEENFDAPTRRVDIFEDAVEVLIRRWDASRNLDRGAPVKGVKRHRYIHMFCRFAAHNFQFNKIIFPKKYAIERIQEWVNELPELIDQPLDAEECSRFLTSIEVDTGIIVSRARNKFSFSHLALEEYFVALSLQSSHAKQSTLDFTRQYITSRKWREVLIFSAEMAGDATELLHTMSTECLSLLRAWPGINAIHQTAFKILQRIEFDHALAKDYSYLVPDIFQSCSPGQQTVRRADSVLREQALSQIQLMYTRIGSSSVRAPRNFLVILHRMLHTHWDLFSRYLGGVPDADPLNPKSEASYTNVLVALEVTVECAMRSSCRDRDKILMRALAGE
jgi:energy-coupling factor transporter ATP-binding protein EcfA2